MPFSVGYFTNRKKRKSVLIPVMSLRWYFGLLSWAHAMTVIPMFFACGSNVLIEHYFEITYDIANILLERNSMK